MAVIISVVSGGSVVQAQQLGSKKNGATTRISAIEGARYVLADTQGGGAAAGVTVKRIGKNLVIGRDLDGAEQEALIIEDYYGSGGQLVAQTADGSYQEYMAVTDGGAVDAAQMSDGASSALTLIAAQPTVLAGEFQFSEGGSSLFGSALASAAVVAGGIALSTGRDGGSKASAAPVASAFVFEDRLADVAAGQPAPAAAGGDVVATVNDTVLDTDSNAVIESGKKSAAEAASASGSNGAVATVAPFAVDDIPVIEKVMDDYGLIQGVIENGGYTDDGYPTIMGKAEPGVKVHIYRNNYLLNYVVADANGEWSYTSTTVFASGKHSITIVHEYPNNEISEPSAPYVITVDRIPPPIPVITGIVDDVGRITGAITDQTVTDDNRPTISGKAEAHAKVIVYDKGKEIGSTTAGADGKWSFTPDVPLADGVHMLSYSALDRAGNSSQQTAVTEFFVDTRPEKINMYYADDNVGSVTGEVFSGGITDDSTPTLIGSATAGGIVKIYEGNTLIGQTVADVDGTWEFTPDVALSKGVHTFHATVTLPAKGESDRSKPFTLEVDPTPMEKPSIDAVHDDAGDVQGVVDKGQPTDDSTPTLVGKAVAGTTVHIYEGGRLLDSVLADENGNWKFTVTTPLIDGDHSFTVKAVSKTGNVSGMSDPYGIVVDTMAPGKPTIVLVDDDQGALTGPVPNGGFTDDTQPAIEGRAEAGSTVIIKDRGVEIARVQADANGDWHFTPEVALDEGAHSITVTATDQAGNVSAPSDAFDFTVDTRQLVKPTIDSVYDDVGAKQGNLSIGDITDDTLPLLKGKAAPNSIVILKDNGVEIGRAPVDASGEWSFQVTVPLGEGVHNLVATAVKKSGEVGESSDSFDFRVTTIDEGPGGYENFNTLAGKTQGLVLPSGVVLAGTYDFNKEGDYYPDGPLPKADRGTGLWILDNATMTIKMPHPTQTVSFFHTAETSGHTVSYFDAAGVKLGQIVLAGGDGYAFRQVSFVAPGGKSIASLQIDSVDDDYTGFLLEKLSWGSRFPTAISIESASVTNAGVGIISGKVAGAPVLEAGTVVQVSQDGGVTWHNAEFSQGSWTFVQNSVPSGEWSAQVRIVDGDGHSHGLTDSTVVEALRALGAPVITDIPEAAGIYTAALALNGSEMTVSLTGTGAKVGDTIHIQWGSGTYDQVLTLVNITTGAVTLNVPAAVTYYSTASYNYDFAVTAQIAGKDGVLGPVSKPYDVVGTYTRAAAMDSLQLAPVNNVYTGNAFKVTTTGTMVNTASTANSVAGLTLTDSLQANATFTLSKPADQIILRFTGADSALSLQVRVYDVKGNLMHEETVFGDASPFHAAMLNWTRSGHADIGSFTVTATGAKVTLDSFTQYVVTHTKDTRDPNLIDALTDSFYASGGGDVASISQQAQTYFAQATAAVHGGSGIDTLKLVGAGHVLNLTTAGSKISSMEIIDITGTGNNTLTLNLSDVLRNGGTDLFHIGDNSRVQMMVKGNAGDRVNLSDLLGNGVDHGDWLTKVPVVIGGEVYISYQHSSLGVELLVSQAVTVVVTNSTVVGVVNAVGAEMSAHLLEDAGVNLFAAETHAPAAATWYEEVGCQKYSYSSEMAGLHDFRLEAY